MTKENEPLFDAFESLITAEDELHAAKAYLHYIEHLPFTEAVAETGLQFPPEGADIIERAQFGESIYRPSKERVRAATEARAIAMQQARAALTAPKSTPRLLVAAADRMARAIDRLVVNGTIGSRSEAADALLDYSGLNDHREAFGIEPLVSESFGKQDA